MHDQPQETSAFSEAQAVALTLRTGPSERMVVLLLSAIAFVVALNAIIVFPLGPFLASGLGFPPQRVGFIAGSYSIAAAIGGLACAIILDRFDRRSALVLFAVGFAAATALSACARDIAELIVLRAIAGLFAGPLSGLLVAIAADNVPAERRGAAVGTLIGTYGLALIVGLPTGVMIATSSAGWQLNFIGIAAVTLLLTAVVARMIGSQRAHLADLRSWNWAERQLALAGLVTSRRSVIAFLLIGSASYAALLISPNLAVFAVRNLGLSPDRLADVYLLGGILTVLAMPLTGRLVDLFGATPVSIIVAIIMTGLLVMAFVDHHRAGLPLVPLLALVIVFQLVRSTVNQTWVTRVPDIAERAAFQSLIAAVTNLAQAAGAASAPLLLGLSPEGRLVGMDSVALLALGTAWATPPLLFLLDRTLGAPRPAPQRKTP